MKLLPAIKKELRSKFDPKRAELPLRYFKTGKGEYGEGDRFLGLTTPEQRKMANNYWSKLSLEDTLELLQRSKFHEERTLSLLIMVLKYKKGSEEEKKKIYSAYLANTKFINNWDLVDVTCRDIVGAYLFEPAHRRGGRDRKILYKLAKSKSLWERRIAIVSTLYFIQRQDLDDTFKLSEILLSDKQDLIHKAVGWMLREAGKRDKSRLIKFLELHGPKMPRTMLRYSIEKFSPGERKAYLAKF